MALDHNFDTNSQWPISADEWLNNWNREHGYPINYKREVLINPVDRCCRCTPYGRCLLLNREKHGMQCTERELNEAGFKTVLFGDDPTKSAGPNFGKGVFSPVPQPFPQDLLCGINKQPTATVNGVEYPVTNFKVSASGNDWTKHESAYPSLNFSVKDVKVTSWTIPPHIAKAIIDAHEAGKPISATYEVKSLEDEGKPGIPERESSSYSLEPTTWQAWKAIIFALPRLFWRGTKVNPIVAACPVGYAILAADDWWNGNYFRAAIFTAVVVMWTSFILAWGFEGE